MVAPQRVTCRWPLEYPPAGHGRARQTPHRHDPPRTSRSQSSRDPRRSDDSSASTSRRMRRGSHAYQGFLGAKPNLVNLKCDRKVSRRIVEPVMDSSFSSSRSHTVKPSLQSGRVDNRTGELADLRSQSDVTTMAAKSSVGFITSPDVT